MDIGEGNDREIGGGLAAVGAPLINVEAWKEGGSRDAGGAAAVFKVVEGAEVARAEVELADREAELRIMELVAWRLRSARAEKTMENKGLEDV